MELQNIYRKETGKEPYFCLDPPETAEGYREEYVEWLEDKVNRREHIKELPANSTVAQILDWVESNQEEHSANHLLNKIIDKLKALRQRCPDRPDVKKPFPGQLRHSPDGDKPLTGPQGLIQMPSVEDIKNEFQQSHDYGKDEMFAIQFAHEYIARHFS